MAPPPTPPATAPSPKSARPPTPSPAASASAAERRSWHSAPSPHSHPATKGRHDSLARTETVLITTAAAAAALAALTWADPAARAQAASLPSPARCSLATLRGTYVWNVQSVQRTGNRTLPFVVAGVETFNGHGHSHGVFSQSTNGKISSRVRFTSTYTTRPDCSGTETITDATGAVTHYDQYTVPDGSRLTFVQTDPGTVSSGVEVKNGH